jgi:nitroreductase
MSQSVIDFLQRRRSVKADLLAEPGPSAHEIETILKVASRVPDHKKLVPWRFIKFEGSARRDFGQLISDVCAANEPDASAVRLETERNRFLRAPLVIAVISRIIDKPGAPEWEQVLSAGAAAFNLCLAANALGYSTCWLTEWMAFDKTLASAMGLAANERVVGFVHIGTATVTPDERVRPDLESIVSSWSAA